MAAPQRNITDKQYPKLAGYIGCVSAALDARLLATLGTSYQGVACECGEPLAFIDSDVQAILNGKLARCIACYNKLAWEFYPRG